MARSAFKNPTAGLSLEQIEDLHKLLLAQMSPGYRLPFMQWFEDDFRGSEGVEEMEPLERLMYRQLLAKAWASKDAPYLPADDSRLRKLSDCPTDELWERHKAGVLVMFCGAKQPGKMYHPRQMVDYVGQLAKVIANTENGGRGGRPRADKREHSNLDSKLEGPHLWKSVENLLISAPPVEKITQMKPK